MNLAGKNVDTSKLNEGEGIIAIFTFTELKKYLKNCEDKKDSVRYKSWTRVVINDNVTLHYIDNIEIELETEDKIRFEFLFEDDTLEDMCVAELHLETGNRIELKIIRKR
ncbi:hypothetical protein [Bacillus toyonensis]|uniref:hypothetical protein n=1 Tax=Bacillus toyonensis TaxID=155322 RepID=UPI000BF50AA7|nr:hypothetical protein [Bacillus toyonensis]PGF05336.1 hypothetical protein COM61_02690 [Bacillus toyonensis]